MFTSPIDPNTFRAKIGFGSWQAILVMILLIVGISSFFLYKRSKKQEKKKLFTFMFLTGTLIGLVMFIVYSLTATQNPEPPLGLDITWVTWEDEVFSILSLATSIYFSLLTLIIPILIFTLLIVIINKNRHNSKVNAKSFFVSFMSLMLMVVIGIAVAFALTPLIKIIVLPENDSSFVIDSGTDYETIPGIINSLVPTSIAVFTSISVILSIVFLGLFFGFILRSLHKTNHNRGEKIIRFFEHLQKVVQEYIKVIALMLPLVIISRIPILFIGDIFENLFNLGIFFVVFIIGWAIVTFMESTIAIAAMRKGINQNISNTRLFFNSIKPYWAESLTKVNTSILLPYTINTSLELNGDKEMSYFTPTLGTAMGQSICGAFYPAFIAIMSANLAGIELGLQFYVLLTIIILVSNIGVTGIPGADSAVNLIVLGSMGIPTTYYMNILVVEPILDSIRTLGNATGFVAATMISSRIVGEREPF